MCYTIVFQQVVGTNWKVAAGYSICAYFVFILYMKNGREYSSFQFAHNIGPYHADIFLGWVIEALSGWCFADHYGGSWFYSAHIYTWDWVVVFVIIYNPLQVLSSLLSSEESSSSSLVPTLPSLTKLQSRPCTKFVIGSLGMYVRHIASSVWCTTHMICS